MEPACNPFEPRGTGTYAQGSTGRQEQFIGSPKEVPFWKHEQFIESCTPEGCVVETLVVS